MTLSADASAVLDAYLHIPPQSDTVDYQDVRVGIAAALRLLTSAHGPRFYDPVQGWVITCSAIDRIADELDTF